MIGSLITSQTRIKLLRKFFLNSSTRSHLRGLEAEFGESSNAIRVELNRLEGAGLLNSAKDGNKKLYQANREHPLFFDIHSIVLKDTGLDKLISKMVNRAGNLMSVYLTGDFACGKDSPVIELILVGEELDTEYLQRKAQQAEEMVGRKVSYTIMEPGNAPALLEEIDDKILLPLWGQAHESEMNSRTMMMEQSEMTEYYSEDTLTETAVMEPETILVPNLPKNGNNTPRWYAVYTRARTEKQAYRNLVERGFNAWLPLYKTLAQWSDRKKMVEKPLLNSYLFVYCTGKDFYNVQGTDGVCNLVRCDNRPVPIPQEQIDNLKLIIDANYKVDVTTEKFSKGDLVEVFRGPLKGLKGELVNDGNRRKLIVRIDNTDHNLIVKVPSAYLKRL